MGSSRMYTTWGGPVPWKKASTDPQHYTLCTALHTHGARFPRGLMSDRADDSSQIKKTRFEPLVNCCWNKMAAYFPRSCPRVCPGPGSRFIFGICWNTFMAHGSGASLALTRTDRSVKWWEGRAPKTGSAALHYGGERYLSWIPSVTGSWYHTRC